MNLKQWFLRIEQVTNCCLPVLNGNPTVSHSTKLLLTYTLCKNNCRNTKLTLSPSNDDTCCSNTWTRTVYVAHALDVNLVHRSCILEGNRKLTYNWSFIFCTSENRFWLCKYWNRKILTVDRINFSTWCALCPIYRY